MKKITLEFEEGDDFGFDFTIDHYADVSIQLMMNDKPSMAIFKDPEGNAIIKVPKLKYN